MLQATKRTARNAVLSIVPAVFRWGSAPSRRRHGLAKPTDRSTFVGTIGSDVSLEIGPFNNPVLTGPTVSYFDVLETDALRARAIEIGLDPANVPKVDFVSPTGDLAIVDRRFHAVLTCHAIEHQPDLIEHLRQVARVLAPGGRYYAIVPDKRFCFDHFMPLTDVADVRIAHRERRQVHTPEAVRAHHLATTHNSAFGHWTGRHSQPPRTERDRDVAEREAARAACGDYVDVHAWFFSPERFRSVVDDLYQAGDIELKPVRVHATQFGDLEFFAVLEREQ